MTTVSPSPPPLGTHLLCGVLQVEASDTHLIFWRDKCNAFFSLFMLGFFFFNIQMGFLPYILSAESSGPHANQTGCHSVSHFVQFHVLFPWKEENYFDRLKPFPYWHRRFVSFSRLSSTVSPCLPGREALISRDAISYLRWPSRVSFLEWGGLWLGWKMEGTGRWPAPLGGAFVL